MPQKVWAVGEEVLAADFNNYVQNQTVPAFTTAAQRDSQWTAPPNGALAVTTDTNTLWQRVSGAWVSAANRTLAVATGTVNVQGAAPSAIDIIVAPSVTVGTGRRIRIDYVTQSALNGAPGGLSAAWVLYRGGTVIQQWSQKCLSTPTDVSQPTFYRYYDSPGAGTYIYKVGWAAAISNGGYDVASANQPRSLTIVDAT